MKTNNIFFLFLMGQLISTSILQAQWVQSNLNSGLGRSLYSDGTTVYAATLQGVYYTNDTGDPWFSIGPQNEDIFSIVKSDNKIIAGSGTDHGVYLSTNNGQDWYQPPTLMNQSIWALAKSNTHIFAGTWGGGVFRSADNGESWESAGLDGRAIRDLLVVDNKLYAASDDFSYGRIYYTSDNGNTWNYGSLDSPACSPRGLLFNDGKLFACDMGLWASTDMGNTWHVQYGLTFDSTGNVTDGMMFRSITKYKQYLIASVDFESIFISSDNGISWNSFNEEIITDWTFVDVEINGQYIWALRESFGNAYRRPLQDIVTTVDEKENIINNFTLYQNYPNPFNPTTTIKISLPKSGLVQVKVYDILGNEIKNLLNEYKQAGTHYIEFDASKLSSGVYFFRISTNNFSDTKKMVLVR